MTRWLLFFAVNILIVFVLTIAAAILGPIFGVNLSGGGYEGLIFFSLLWGMGGSIISLLMSKFMAKMMMGVQIVEPHGQYGELVRKVHHLAKRAGIEKMPEVGIYNSPDVNAFATGPSKNNSLVAVSTGLLQRLGDEEVEGVLGHEVAHIANGDMVTMTLLQGIINAFVIFFARVAAMAVDRFLRQNSDDGEGLGYFAYYIVVMLFQSVFGLLGMMVVASFSRYREFRADSGGARLAGKEKMVNALRALQSAYPQLAEQEEKTAIRSMQISSKYSMLALLSTHPPLEKRIAALEKVAY